jgi:Na+/H+ antiporter NhaD/arsenite permease-like protein
MSAAILAIVLDTIVNKRNGIVIMKKVDWSILMMFFGIFIWLDGFNRTHVPRFIWCHLGLAGKTISSLEDIVILATFVIFGSNIFSNVPLTIIVLDQLEPCKDQLALVLYLAWCATIAGNLTLFGSVANLIVAQKAKQTINFNLTFRKYFWYGFPSTLIITTVGMLPLYLLLYLKLDI